MVEEAINKLGSNTKIARLNNPLLKEKWKRTPELRKKGREILGLNEDDVCVLCVGQLENRKGCIDFIRIGEKFPHLQFRWVGGRPFRYMTDGYIEIDQEIKKAPAHIQFAGIFPLDEMPALYAAGDLFVFPSYQENCPLAPIEAAASGMPVIFRDLEEYKSLYKNEYLKAGSNEAFTALIEKLITDKESYKQAVELSESLILQFDKHEIGKQLISIYKSVLADSQAMQTSCAL